MSRTSRTLFYLAVVLMCFVLMMPIMAFLVNAFAYRWFYPQLVPQEWSLQAWERIQLIPPEGERTLEAFIALILSGRSAVINAMWTSIALGLVVTVAGVLVGLPAARALGMHKFRGKRVVEFMILAPTIVPAIAFVLGLNINFIRWGMSGTFGGVALVHLVPVLPYVVLTLSGVFANYNPEFEEQARTLGAGPIRTFWHVTLPAIFPGLVVAALFAFLVSWAQYLLTFLIGAGRVITMPILLFSAASGGNNAVIAAMSLVFIAPAILTLLVTSRYLSGESGAVGGFGRI